MKKVTYVTLAGAYLFSKVRISDAKIAYLSYRMVCTFQKSCHLLNYQKC